MNELKGLFRDAELALEEIGMSDAADALRGAVRLDGRYGLERVVMVLNGVGPELVHAYVRAGKFVKKASASVRQDALKYQRDLFTARCYVSALKAATKQTLRGNYMLN